MVQLDGLMPYSSDNGKKIEIKMKVCIRLYWQSWCVCCKMEDLASNFGNEKYLLVEESYITCDGGLSCN